MNMKNTNYLLICGAIISIIAITLISGCTTQSGTPTVTASATPVASQTTLVMGIIPSENAQSEMQMYAPLQHHIENETGYNIQLFVATDYTGVITAMKSKHVDFAFFGPFSYVLAANQSGAQAFAVGVDSTGTTTYHSMLIATPDVANTLGITTPLLGLDGMKTLAGKLSSHKGQYQLAFTDPASTSGYAVPRAYMAEAGMDPNAVFKKVGFVGSHDAAILSVKQKTSDMAATNNQDFAINVDNKAVTAQDDINIWNSQEISGSPFAYRSDLSDDEKTKISHAIIDATKDDLNGTGYVQFVPTNDSAYTEIYTLQNTIASLPST
jgi:phosphonate transport system substrate-binding protein